jgi:hypothetical protein
VDLMVTDATTSGHETARLLLEGVPSPVTVRELIRLRVREEVARHNAAPSTRFAGLVRPTDAEADRNGWKLPRPRTLDWEAQAAAALTAFAANGFVMFAGDRQLDDPDEELTLGEADVVSFVRLVPLVGG